MTTKKKFLLLLFSLCLILSMGVTAFAASYSGTDVKPGLSGIQPGDRLTLPDNTEFATLTASWGVRVRFIDWDETELQTEVVPVTDSTPGSTMVPADPTRSGYTFTGWERYDALSGTATLNNDGSVAGVNGPGPIVFIATYTKSPAPIPDPDTYRVVFVMGGHGAAPADQMVNEGSKATKPTDPTASGWTFGGWYADSTFQTAFDFDTAIHADTTLYAKWVTNSTKPIDPNVPKTGDNSNMLLWAMLFAASGAALTGTAIYSRKKKKTN